MRDSSSVAIHGEEIRVIHAGGEPAGFEVGLEGGMEQIETGVDDADGAVEMDRAIANDATMRMDTDFP